MGEPLDAADGPPFSTFQTICLRIGHRGGELTGLVYADTDDGWIRAHLALSLFQLVFGNQALSNLHMLADAAFPG